MTEPTLNFSVLIKKEEDYFVAHCLELDLVATADTTKKVKEEIISLIIAQVDYAFSNNNLENLYRPAPSELWQEFFRCKSPEIEEVSQRINQEFKSADQNSPPPWMIAKICNLFTAGHA